MATAAPALPRPHPLPHPHPHPLPRPSLGSLRHLGPNWYAPVMGTAIVGTAGAGLPGTDGIPGLRTACTAVWALSLALLLTLLGARALHWVHHRDQARAQLLDPATAPFYGCLAMALTAVGGGTLTVGRDWIGVPAALALDAVLFTAGTVVSLVAAVAVPYLLVVRGPRRGAGPGHVSPVWLLPVVAPMVSAALGPLLVPHLPPGQGQRTLLFACFGMFGLSVADELRFPGRSRVSLDAGKRSVVLGGVWTPAGGPWAVAAGCGAGAHRVRYLPPVAPPAAAIRRLRYPPRRTLSAPVWTRAGRGPRVAFLGTGRILKETGIVIAAPTGLAVTRTLPGTPPRSCTSQTHSHRKVPQKPDRTTLSTAP